MGGVVSFLYLSKYSRPIAVPPKTHTINEILKELIKLVTSRMRCFVFFLFEAPDFNDIRLDLLFVFFLLAAIISYHA